MADLATLKTLHCKHVFAIPFENLDIQMGLPIRLDLPSLERKLVAGRRGGYCFEQNTLFLAGLRAAGFDAIAGEARVRSGGVAVRPRTHMVLVVSLEGRRWLSDVGFGGDGPIEPVPLDGEKVEQLGDAIRVAPEGPLLVLQVRRAVGWEDLYAFLPEERHPVDFEMASWFTSTYPDSSFVKTLTVQQATPEGRHVLRGLSHGFRRGDAATSRPIARADLLSFLKATFGIELPEGTRFPSLDG